jgi:hypothetical protein
MPYQIISAAAAVVANLVRLIIDQSPWSEADQATAVPMITPKLVEGLAYAGATDAEIADRFLLDESVISNEYRQVLRVARAVRRMQLRGAQFDLAKKGNGPMLTWLGRNELGQSLNPTIPGQPMPSILEEEHAE